MSLVPIHRKEVDMLADLRKQLEARLATGVEEIPPPIQPGRQFLSFKVAQQELLIAVDDVLEIVMPPPIAFIPKAQRELEGVIALRGEIMPVVNLRRMMGFTAGKLSPATRVLILRPEDDNFGLIVDEITEFVWLEDQVIDVLAPEYLNEDFKVVSHVAKSAGIVRPILDVDRVLQTVFARGERNEQYAS